MSIYRTNNIPADATEPYILEHMGTNPLTHETYVKGYEWIGPVNDPIYLDRHFLGVVLRTLPWPLKELPKKPGIYFGMGKTFIREDAGYWKIYHWLVARWSIHCWAFRIFEQRLIFTCHVWGLGWTKPYEIPMWENITRRNP